MMILRVSDMVVRDSLQKFKTWVDSREAHWKHESFWAVTVSGMMLLTAVEVE